MSALPEVAPAIVISSFGGPENLSLQDVPVPEIGPDDVLIRIEAAGVNRADAVQREGQYPPPPGESDILGLEVAGTIAAIGDDVTEWANQIDGSGDDVEANSDVPPQLVSPAGDREQGNQAVTGTGIGLYRDVDLGGRDALKTGECRPGTGLGFSFVAGRHQ